MLGFLFACAHPVPASSVPSDSAELQALFDADQADRQIRPPDWSVVGPRTVDATGTKTLDDMEPGVTDAMRAAMQCPTLEEARSRETPR